MYRNDIDGLRAVAVILVCLFHVGVTALAGGYVGVDVFFVISGFLITRNILRDGSAFWFGEFYWRRVRRLMPAVWVTTIVTMLAASAVMRPDALDAAAWSAVATTLSVSNFYFWSQAGYWDTSGAFKPLLHTWSLAVEEQFYLFWPLLLFLLRPLHARWTLTATFVGLFAAGTVLSVWATNRFPSAAFYLMPFRVMEFAIGAALASMEQHRRIQLPAAVQQALPIAGLALIALSALTFDEKTAFPGIAALVPCLGAALVIAGGSATVTARALANPAAVYVGQISYSLYLVHWPVVSLYKYATLASLTPTVQVTLLALMFVLAVLLHHLVEKPFRYGGAPRPALVMGLAGALTIAVPAAQIARAQLVQQPVVTAASAPAPVEPEKTAEAQVPVPELIAKTAGAKSIEPAKAASPQAVALNPNWPAALDVPRQKFYDDRLRYVCSINEPACNEPQAGKINILVIGDSHGADAHTIMATAFPGAHIIPGGRASCMSSVGAERWYVETKRPDNDDRRGCLWNVNRIYNNRAMLEKVDLIAFNFLPTGAEVPLLDETLAYLSQVTKARIVVFGTAPWFDQELPDIVRTKKLTPADPVPAEFIRPVTWEADAKLRAVATKHGAMFVSKVDFFCPKRVCKPFTPDQTVLIAYDRDHMSFQASEAFGLAVKPKLNTLLKR